MAGSGTVICGTRWVRDNGSRRLGKSENAYLVGYGFFKGSLEFFEDQEKMVADAADRRIDHPGLIDRVGRKFRPRSVHLHIILMMTVKN
jgi:hypothetical protein